MHSHIINTTRATWLLAYFSTLASAGANLESSFSSKTKELFLSTISTVMVEREDGSML